ncbi:MAG: hypothetical protein Kow0092_32660 [Deferrisomatales bacterium]
MSDPAKKRPEPRAEPVLLPDVVVHCPHCGYQGPAEPQAPGKAWLEAVLWIVFVVPGLLYSLWRLFARRYLCPRCKAADGRVSVPASRRIAVAVRAVLMIAFLVAVAVLVLMWNYPATP